ncbi:hypothetical protein QFC21_006755 [Naganishia friedmannii]|uniref:Uncharacterized protein n=1 Tax=Naganishia friedmannii TaxID=89922 RepID=A0ACC2V0T9_9TREE|nr:hypothetical protein QFC21_006755 [Naganishia friedmannii]
MMASPSTCQIRNRVLTIQAQSSPQKTLQSSSATASAYPQLSNLYPSDEASAGPSTGSTSGRPATGPGAGFPARQPPSAPANAYGGYGASTSSNLYGNGYGGGMAMGGSGMGQQGGDKGEKNVAQLIVDSGNKWSRAYRTLLDRSTPLTVERWIFTGVVLVIFIAVVLIRQGADGSSDTHVIVSTDALAIYLLNLFLAFLQPKFDPSIQQDLAAEDVEEGAPGLPGANTPSSSKGGLSGLMNGFSAESNDEEFRPFIRRLPEFKFWLSATKASLLALFATTSRVFDVPVYWPILLMYFFILFGLTMRRQIQHMIKYRYIPFDLGRKATYGRKK